MFKNLMIQASAGSGKTHDLVGRYLRLLDAFEKPQAIVALTFTRKAASEFFDRILSALAEAAADDKAAAKAAKSYSMPALTRGRALQLLRLVADHLHELSLGTLDGFYARVLRAFPAEFGVTADYEVLDETAATAARREVLDGVLQRSDEEAAETFLEAFRKATFGTEERSVARLLEDYVKKFHGRYLGVPAADAWGSPTRIWPDGAWWMADPGFEKVQRALKEISTAADDCLAGAKPRKAVANALNGLVKVVAKVQPGFIPGTLPKFFSNVLEVLEGLHRGTVDEVPYHGKTTMELTGDLRDAVVTAAHWVLWCELSAKLEQTGGVREIVRRYEERYDQQVRRVGKLGFDDLLAVLAGVAPVREAGTGARLLLSADRNDTLGDSFSEEDREALRLLVDYRLDAQFQHWLIDEFQDTSRRQWQVLRNLIDEVMFDDSGERSFYYVGDVKQAIFGWRGGDSRLFDEVRRRYETLPEGRRIELDKLDNSWRSGEVILKMVNLVFGNAQVLAEVIGDEHRAVIDERWATIWGDHQSNVLEQTGYARWVTVPKPEGERDVPKDLRWKVVLATLQELRLKESKLSCAILVRRGKSAHELADYIRQHSEIPVMVEGKMAVGVDHPVGTSFASLLRWSAHPGDTRSREHIRMTPPHAALPEDEVARWENLTPPLVLRLVHDFGFGLVFEWWCLLLRKQAGDGAGGRMDEFSEHRIAQIAEACRHFDDSGERSIDEFLEFLGGYEAADLPEPGTVQLMTVHKAKGLTFDAVIIADIEGSSITSAGRLDALEGGDGSGDPDWLLMRPKKELALAVEPLGSAYRQAEMDAAFEELCVLYVSLTRARYANFVISAPPSKEKDNCSPARILQETLVAADPQKVDVDGLEVDLRYEDGDSGWLSKVPARPLAEKVSAVPREEVSRQRVFPPRIRRLPSSAGSDGRPFGDANLWFGAVNARATGFGTAVHALFECIGWIDDVTDEELAAAWQQTLAGQEEFAEEARDVVAASLRNPEIRQLFERPAGKGRAEVWQEKRFEMILDGGQWVSGVFDRVNLFDGHAQIIDFKSNNVTTDEDIHKAVAHYRPQMETYRVALSRLTGLPPGKIDCMLVFTGPQSIEMIDCDPGSKQGPVSPEPECKSESKRVQGELDL